MAKEAKTPKKRKPTLDFRRSPVEAAPIVAEANEPGTERLKDVYLYESVYRLFKKHVAGLDGPMTHHLNRIVSEYLRSNGINVPDPPPRKNARRASK